MSAGTSRNHFTAAKIYHSRYHCFESNFKGLLCTKNLEKLVSVHAIEDVIDKNSASPSGAALAFGTYCTTYFEVFAFCWATEGSKTDFLKSIGRSRLPNVNESSQALPSR